MNKKGIVITLILAILCLGIGFGGSYILFKDKATCEKEKCEENNEVTKCDVPFDEETENVEQHTADYNQLLDKINDMRYLEYLDENFKVEELTNLEMLQFAMNFIGERYS